MQFTSAFVLAGLISAGPGARPIADELSCPEGFMLNGKQCVRQELEMPDVTCKIGSLQDNMCILTAPMETACPYGTILENGQCVIKRVTMAQTECPSGFHMDNGMCVRQTPLKTVELCRIGHEVNGECVVKESVSRMVKRKCPSGYFAEGDVCLRVTEYDCTPEVPPLKEAETDCAGNITNLRGLTKKNKGGYVAVSAPIMAPAPVIATTAAPRKTVEGNIAVVRQKCRRQDFMPMVQESSCPSGYSEVQDRCEKVSVFPKERTCETGAPVEHCFNREVTSPIVSCADGARRGNECIISTSVPQVSACPAGTQNDNGRCLVIEAPQIGCRAGFRLQDNMCLKQDFAEPTGVITKPCVGKGCYA